MSESKAISAGPPGGADIEYDDEVLLSAHIPPYKYHWPRMNLLEDVPRRVAVNMVLWQTPADGSNTRPPGDGIAVISDDMTYRQMLAILVERDITKPLMTPMVWDEKNDCMAVPPVLVGCSLPQAVSAHLAKFRQPIYCEQGIRIRSYTEYSTFMKALDATFKLDDTLALPVYMTVCGVEILSMPDPSPWKAVRAVIDSARALAPYDGGALLKRILCGDRQTDRPEVDPAVPAAAVMSRMRRRGGGR